MISVFLLRRVDLVRDARTLGRYAEEMFDIPSDLPLKLSALAWLLGHWQGWGTIPEQRPKPAPSSEPAPDATPPLASGQGDAPASGDGEPAFLPVVQDIDAAVVGEQMRMTIRTFEGHLEGEFDPTWTAHEGLDRIQPGELISEETTYWVVDTPLAIAPATADEPRELRVVSSSTQGFAILWAGVAMGPRIQLVSDALVRAPAATAVDHFSRMFGLVGGELMWASEFMSTGGAFDVEITGRLLRATPAKVGDHDD